MRMLSVLSVVAVSLAGSFAVPAHAETADSGSFKHGGYTYVYKTQQVGEAQVISGRRYPGGTAFSLRVRNGEVSGVSNGVSVSFNVNDAAGAADGAQPTQLSLR
ncbi:MAG: hypothetical protein AB7E05_00525 [Sphingobium sp.]